MNRLKSCLLVLAGVFFISFDDMKSVSIPIQDNGYLENLLHF